MAVYTQVDEIALSELLKQYDIGHVIGFKGLLEGVENTNYMLETSTGQYILTIYEHRVNPEDLPFFMKLLEHLGNKNYPCPPPILRNDRQALSSIQGKPTAIFPFLQGVSTSSPSVIHCRAVGEALARLHLSTQDFDHPPRANSMGLESWKDLYAKTSNHADEIMPGLSSLIKQSLTDIEKNWPSDLPSGICHADLFSDNVLFNGTQIGGVIDFYFACNDFLLYDLAITINAWSFSPFGSFYYSNSYAMIHAYHKIRPITQSEHDAFLLMMQASAIRFLMTRLYDWINTPKDAVVKRKNPMEYVRVLRFIRETHSPSFFGLEQEMIQP